MKLIRLTHYRDGSLALVNVEKILMVYKDFSMPEYTIVDCGDTSYAVVKESVEAVENLIHQATDSYFEITKDGIICKPKFFGFDEEEDKKPEEQVTTETMTYGEMYNKFCKTIKTVEVEDYRPNEPFYVGDTVEKPGIIVWLENGDKMMYFPKELLKQD